MGYNSAIAGIWKRKQFEDNNKGNTGILANAVRQRVSGLLVSNPL